MRLAGSGMLVLLGAPWVGGALQVVGAGGVGLLLLPVGWIMMVVGWARLARVDIRFGVAAGLMALLAVAALPFASPLTGAFFVTIVVPVPVDPMYGWLLGMITVALAHVVPVAVAARALRRLARTEWDDVVRWQTLVIELMAWSTIPLTLAEVPGALLGVAAALWMAVLQLAVAGRCTWSPRPGCSRWLPDRPHRSTAPIDRAPIDRTRRPHRPLCTRLPQPLSGGAA